MNTKCAVAVISCLLAFGFACLGEPPNNNPPEKREKPIEDLKTQLAGTTWRAVPIGHTHPGLAAMETFTEETVAPQGYHYDVHSAESLTIHFNHGDTQDMALTSDGRHLQFKFRENGYVYELVEEGEKPSLDLKTQLPGTTWRALPIGHLEPGLAAKETFSKDTVAPQGYHYDVNSANSITIHFNHGGTQLMLLETSGKRLKFVFKGQDYEYERVPK